MLISKFTKSIETTLGKSLSFSLILNKISETGTEIEINRLYGYKFYTIDTNDEWISKINPPFMFVRDEPSDIFKDICLREELEFDFILDYPMSKREILIERKKQGMGNFPIKNEKLRNFISFNNTATWLEVEKDTTRISGRVNFKSFAGIAKLTFYEAVENIELEIISYKLNYEDDFKALLTEIAEYHSELILSLDQPTEVALGIDQMNESSAQVSILQLRRLMERNNLPLAIETILANPHKKMSQEVIIDDNSHIVNVDFFEITSNPSNLNWVRGGSLRRIFKGLTPATLPEETFEYILDTHENQFVKFCLEELAVNIETLLNNIPLKFSNSKKFLVESLDRIEEYLNAPFFRNIGPFRRISNSMVMQKRNGYKEFYTLLQEFEMGLKLESNISELDSVNGDLRPIHKLYEYWCYFSLLGILGNLCGDSVKSNILIRTEKGYSLNLREKSNSQVSFRYNNSNINLFYNRDFGKNVSEFWEGSYDGGIYHPDFSIEIITNGKSHWIHFDAKYKLDYAKFQLMIKEGDGEGADSPSGGDTSLKNGNYKRNDIYTAHAYRDAILGSRGVYILYPDNIEQSSLFSRSPQNEYFCGFPSIGAIPLRPGKNEFNIRQQQSLKKFIENILNVFTMDDIEYQEEVGILRKSTIVIENSTTNN